MSNSYFQFKQFIIHQDKCAMKVTTDGCLFGAWAANAAGSQKSAVTTVLDIGTGTGLLSLMLAQKNSTLTIDAVEIDKDAAEQADENVKKSPWSDRIQVNNIDANKLSIKANYDLIISNPPFYENDLKSSFANKNVAHHGDELVLENLLNIIRHNLNPEGIFMLLLPYKRHEEIKKLFFEAGLAIKEITFVRQSTNHDFFRIMLLGNLSRPDQCAPEFSEVSIKNTNLPNADYTLEFKSLLKDYYLHL